MIEKYWPQERKNTDFDFRLIFSSLVASYSLVAAVFDVT